MPLVIAALLVPLALTAHHTGVVALAPVVAVSPGVVRWARTRLLAALSVIVASVSWCVVLAFVGSDVGQRLADAGTTRTYGISSSWRQELERYTSLNGFPYATPLRRESVALIALGLFLYVTRRQRRESTLVNLPATMLAAALALLVLTPSKFPWHFGALTGLAALTIGAEVARIRRDGSDARGWQIRAYLITGASIVATYWAWYPRDSWNPFDLRTLTWIPGPDAGSSFTTLALAIPVVAVTAAMVMSVRPSGRFMGARIAGDSRHGRFRSRRPDDLLHGWRAGGRFEADSRMDTYQAEHGLDRRAWGLWAGRRRGRFACRLGAPTIRRSIRARGAYVDSAGSYARPSALRTLVVHDDHAMVSATRRRPLRPVHRRVDCSRRPAFARVGPSRNMGRLQALRTDAVAGIVSAATPWTFVGASELPKPAAGANAVRIVRNATNPPQAPLAVTAPVRYRQASLSGLLTEQGATALIHPALLLYFPCARQPALRAGIVDAPNYIVWYGDTYQPLLFAAASPFAGVRDVFPVQRLPSSDGTSSRAGDRLQDRPGHSWCGEACAGCSRHELALPGTRAPQRPGSVV